MEFVICGTLRIFNQSIIFISRFCRAYNSYKFLQSQPSWCNFTESNDRYIEKHLFVATVAYVGSKTKFQKFIADLLRVTNLDATYR
jgi:hypothetical protein